MNKYEKLLSSVWKTLDDYRYKHVFSVYNECIRLSDIFFLSEKDTDTLLTASILHDITKSVKDSEQIGLADSMGIKLSKYDRESPKTLHAITGAELIKTEYPTHATAQVCSAIRYHTTGKANMTIVEKLLYLADYIEPTRTFEDCRQVRDLFYSLLDSGMNKRKCLDKALLLSFDLTISELIHVGGTIHPDTVISRNYILKNLDY